MAIYRQTNEDTIFHIFYDLGNLDVRYNIDTLSKRVDSFINQGIELEWVIDHDNFCIFVFLYFCKRVLLTGDFYTSARGDETFSKMCW